MACFAYQGRSVSGTKYVYFACVSNPEWILNPQSPGGSLYIPGENGNPLMNFSSWWTTADEIILCDTPSAFSSAQEGRRVRGSCNNCAPSDTPSKNAFDCINGICRSSTQHSTEGLYLSLSDCEKNCGSSSGCNGECVSGAQISQLKNLANRLKSKNCGH